MKEFLNEVAACSFCTGKLPLGIRPLVQYGASSKVVIIGQAPGRLAHESGIPWNDASGRTLRKWLDVDNETFYNPSLFSIFGMGFCYPGKGKSGDLPPIPQCAGLWHQPLLDGLKSDPVILLIGQYAQRYYLKEAFKGNLTSTVQSYQQFAPKFFPLPHPSPRNQHWLKINPWFLTDTVPYLRTLIRDIL
jgi:uracil-DNA glycosylase